MRIEDAVGLCFLFFSDCSAGFRAGRLYITGLMVSFAMHDELFFIRSDSNTTFITPHTKIRNLDFCLNTFHIHSFISLARSIAVDSALLSQRCSWPGAGIAKRRRLETASPLVREAVLYCCSLLRTGWVHCTPGSSPRDTIDCRLWTMTHSLCGFLNIAKKLIDQRE